MKKGKGVHQIPSSTLQMWEQLIMAALLLQLCFCCFSFMEKYPTLDVCLKHEKYQ